VLLHTREWGDAAAPPIVSLHGVTAHGGRSRKLAQERLADRYRVVAFDLRGHGHSGYEPPWDIETHLVDIRESLAALGIETAVFMGSSFGGRLTLELAAASPELVERAILLDPAIQVLPHVALDMAELGRHDETFTSHEEAVELRLASPRLFHTPREIVEEEMREHLERQPDGTLRFRFCRSAVIAAWSEMATDPPPFERARIPTLVVIGAQSWLVLDDQLAAYRSALGDLLTVVTVPGGHTVHWDAFDETSDAIDAFLAAT
jgi:lipase